MAEKPAEADALDPAFKKLSLMNGRINRLSREELKLRLDEFQLDNRYAKLCILIF